MKPECESEHRRIICGKCDFCGKKFGMEALKEINKDIQKELKRG